MEAGKDFNAFYQQKIAPILDELKQENKSSSQWGWAIALSVILAIGCFAGIRSYGTGLGLFFVVAAIFCIYMYTRSGDRYTDHFKEAIIQQVIDHIHPGIVYKPDSFVPSKEYRTSGLYRRRYYDIDGDDYMEGIYKDVSFKCSELLATTRSDAPTAISARNYNIFKGLFFSAEVNPAFTGGTYVWRKDHEQLGASIADERYRLYPIPKVYHMDMGDWEFKEHFVVYSSYPSQARTILTDELMHNLVKFKKQLGRNISFSVVAGRCYVTIPINEDLLESSDNIADEEAVKEYFFTVLLVLSVINQLELYILG